MCLGKFHSVFVGSCGGVWSCGHGEGGRLGIATRDTRVLPVQISLSEPCIDAAVGRDHTLLLLKSGTVIIFYLYLISFVSYNIESMV